jgi:hypothetical protein
MNELMQPTSRRTLLQRGLVVLAGALGMRVTEGDARGEPAPLAPTVRPGGGRTLRLYGRQLRVQSHGQRPGQLPLWSGQCHGRCELLDQPGGRRIGEFSATGFCPDSAAFSRGQAAGQVELQTLQVEGDHLFGIGPGGIGAAGETAHAVLGGTGRFAGARGTYTIRGRGRSKAESQIEFVINLVS